jgi:Dolichyl-phosphate-mannose-protein mannosyltransferase
MVAPTDSSIQKLSNRSVIHRIAHPLALCVVWIVAALLIDPTGDFPLNDDWAYGLPVEVLVRDGTIRFTFWQSMTLITQVFWGALFCLPAGFSYTALRISTLIAGLGGVLGLYALLRHFRASPAIAFVGAALMATNPIYLGLSYSFMTDIPFLALMLWAAFCVIRGLDRDRGGDGWFAAGLGIALAATFIRQLGLAIFLGLLIVYPLRRGLNRGWLLRTVLPTIAAGVLMKAYTTVLDAAGRLPRMYYLKPNALSDYFNDLFHLRLGALKVPLEGVMLTLMYCGLFMMPFLVLLEPRRSTSRMPNWLRPVLVALAAMAVTAAAAAFGRPMPMTGNILVDLGLGIRALPGPALPGAPYAFWIAVTFAASLGAVGLVVALVDAARATWARPFDPASTMPIWHFIFLGSIAALYLGPFFLMYQLILDRYFLLPAALIMALALGGVREPGPRPSRLRWVIAIAIVCVMGTLGIAMAHDYMSWNRARWSACTELVEQDKIALGQIDGGFEFNNQWPNRALMEQGGAEGIIESVEGQYQVAFRPMPGHTVISRVPCSAWLPYAPREILVLKRDGL